MGKNDKVSITVLVAFLLLLFLGIFIAKDAYERSPKYVLEKLTPPYESNAKDFFYQNQNNLVRLSKIYNNKVDSYFYYTFNQHKFDTPGIPDEVHEILNEIEKRTYDDYTVLITQYEIIIFLGSGTHFEVYLHYGTPPLFDSARDRKIELDSGWSIYSEYVLRG